MTDDQTLGTYNARAQTYVDMVSRSTPDSDLQAFLDALPKGARVLDLGCGPGNTAAMMRDHGLRVDAIDASSEMVRIAKETYQIDARLESFDDLDAIAQYDGIWANFSLLHAKKSDMPRHLSAIKTALKSNGLFHLGLKTGDDSARDALGRFYTYYGLDEIVGLLTTATFTTTRIRLGSVEGLAGGKEPFMIVTAYA